MLPTLRACREVGAPALHVISSVPNVELMGMILLIVLLGVLGFLGFSSTGTTEDKGHRRE